MKKTLKLLTILSFMLVALLLLTGCGNKLVATKTIEEDDDFFGIGTYESKIEISFKSDEVDNVKMTLTFEDKEEAEDMAALMAVFMEEESGYEVEQKGKKVIMELDTEAYADLVGEDISDFTEEEIRENLEEDGFTVK